MIHMQFSVRHSLPNTFIKDREPVREKSKSILYQGLSNMEHKQVQQELTGQALEVQKAC